MWENECLKLIFLRKAYLIDENAGTHINSNGEEG
jgi:hypothetical protein